MSFRVDELVARLGGELAGDGSVVVHRIASLEDAGAGELAFAASRKYLSRVADSRAAALIVPPQARDLDSRPRIISADPYLYFARAAQLFNPLPLAEPGVHRYATVLSSVPGSVQIDAGASIAEDVELGEGVIIGAGSHVGRGCRIGAGTRLAPHVVVYPGCTIGARCILHAGVVIGSDGFGFARTGTGEWEKIPQVGAVRIGDDVEIGANTTVDRGALGDTVIEDGCKLDNQIQIAHNVHVGAHTVIAGCAGIAGSARIGRRCMIGGQAGIIGHLHIADDVVISARTLVSKSITQAGTYTASLPQQTHADWAKNFAHLRQLDAMAKRVRALERQLQGRDDSTAD